jgi:hypothetical protein
MVTAGWFALFLQNETVPCAQTSKGEFETISPFIPIAQITLQHCV